MKCLGSPPRKNTHNSVWYRVVCHILSWYVHRFPIIEHYFFSWWLAANPNPIRSMTAPPQMGLDCFAISSAGDGSETPICRLCVSSGSFFSFDKRTGVRGEVWLEREIIHVSRCVIKKCKRPAIKSIFYLKKGWSYFTILVESTNFRYAFHLKLITNKQIIRS